ncbi:MULTISPECIES: PolC-type DNA polymerase III [Pseudomonas]|uniref:Exonuclease family protein n=1 Tax=Pseudomonas chlororaphis O6 TaxID=1037915 RepID=A0AB33WWC1_9PSED|nr:MULTISPECIES: 3'-5' exonuclease [Pseudomonas]AZD63169.1 DEDDh DNA polymerase III 3'-5' exonuclease domain [Pseudomonas chlororaphis subsp. aurantiaca]AZD88659.1 DEDDh DNA polymerase III 3'-5' exonuclease domain [Pseudomonas chlororaphis subsp. aureofaciens]AZD95072.1 DEDDh DNA polymerase III 3'-5' exonuclease domain [Pseudomonas chlororaphis subsp. aureofaciens]AZE01404.1 DEDDh DNA polymerase III 3'-5' exonuclease domain [Pseudomonas chlororaphis subsp. aureofaciens]AZE07524.1 DEDDh DNA pol
MERIAVIDFETTGISPSSSCRATEIAVVILEQGRIVERYQSLMNAGVRVPAFIEQLTGISNAMLRSAPPAEQVMNEVNEFVGTTPLLAHNAAFDQKFWDYELGRIKRTRLQNFACSLLLARRLMPAAPNHKLGTLTTFACLPHTGQAHRAMADAEMAANLTAHLALELRQKHGLRELSHDFLCKLQKVPAAKIGEHLKRHRGA